MLSCLDAETRASCSRASRGLESCFLVACLLVIFRQPTATWDDTESESEEENDAAHMCFMAHRDDASKVTLDNSINDDELTMDELA